jgi:hypothetical protein
MLRCAGCSDLVSEFAARCPACRRPTDDAHEVDEPPDDEMLKAPALAEGRGGGISLEPGLDSCGSMPANGRRRGAAGRRRPKTIMAVVAAAVLAGSWLTVLAELPWVAGPPQSGPAHGGRVVSESPDGTVVVSDPNGSNMQTLRSFPLQTGSSDQELVVAADERFLLSGIHTLITATGPLPTPVDSNVLFSPAMTPVRTSPFADHDRAVVVLTGGSAPTTSAVSLVLVADGATLALGEADQAAGDPQSLGAFLTVAAPTQPNVDGWHSGPYDTAVELRDPGRSTLLATSASLNRALGQNPDRPVALRIVPDSAGNKLAVVIEPAASTGPDAALVVLDRRGRVLNVLNRGAGPVRGSVPSWSPDGAALAYHTVTPGGAAIAVWPIGGPVHLRVAPNPDTSFAGCLWAPDNSRVLCSTGSKSPQWIFVPAHGGPLITITAPTFVGGFSRPLRPVAWLPGPSQIMGPSDSSTDIVTWDRAGR